MTGTPGPGTSLQADIQENSDDTSSLSSVNTVDIEDAILEEPPTKRQKQPETKRSANARRSTATNPMNGKMAKESGETEQKGARRAPARNVKETANTPTATLPPSNWEVMYDTVKKMREENPTAPVDTMGCAELYWRGSSPRDQRFQTLVALMLSSQTKDTVTALAMERLHRELGRDDKPSKETMSAAQKKKKDNNPEPEPEPEPYTDSHLNLENILSIPPDHLNELIGAVGFHNNKTKYIKSAAVILRDQYNSDIPTTAQELMKLPGVGPKMAYLCMSAAWGRHEGIGVDVHVHRITNLWGWHKTKTPEETRMALQSWLPKEKWHEINKMLVGFGQTVCLPVGRRCGDCYLAGTKLCKSEVKGLSSKGAS